MYVDMLSTVCYLHPCILLLQYVPGDFVLHLAGFKGGLKVSMLEHFLAEAELETAIAEVQAAKEAQRQMGKSRDGEKGRQHPDVNAVGVYYSKQALEEGQARRFSLHAGPEMEWSTVVDGGF